jgi:hypothetical protein
LGKAGATSALNKWPTRQQLGELGEHIFMASARVEGYLEGRKEAEAPAADKAINRDKVRVERPDEDLAKSLSHYRAHMHSK